MSLILISFFMCRLISALLILVGIGIVVVVIIITFYANAQPRLTHSVGNQSDGIDDEAVGR